MGSVGLGYLDEIDCKDEYFYKVIQIKQLCILKRVYWSNDILICNI